MKFKAENVKLIKHANSPILAVGAGAAFLAAAYNAPLTKKKCEKTKIIKVKKASPLLLDFKKIFKAEDTCPVVIQELPENFYPVASSQHYEYEIVHETEKPFFGVHFTPTTLDTLNVLRNFERFLVVWEKYHNDRVPA